MSRNVVPQIAKMQMAIYLQSLENFDFKTMPALAQHLGEKFKTHVPESTAADLLKATGKKLAPILSDEERVNKDRTLVVATVLRELLKQLNVPVPDDLEHVINRPRKK